MVQGEYLEVIATPPPICHYRSLAHGAAFETRLSHRPTMNQPNRESALVRVITAPHFRGFLLGSRNVAAHHNSDSPGCR
jgi:hypothetical protein